MQSENKIREALEGGFMTCQFSAKGKPRVVIEFGELVDAQRLHRMLAALASEGQESGEPTRQRNEALGKTTERITLPLGQTYTLETFDPDEDGPGYQVLTADLPNMGRFVIKEPHSIMLTFFYEVQRLQSRATPPQESAALPQSTQEGNHD